MLGIVLVAALGALLLILWLLPVRLSLSARGRGTALSVTVNGAFLFWRLEWQIDVAEKVEAAVEHMVKRWFGTSEPVAVPFQKTLRRFPTGRVILAAKPPIKRFLRRSVLRKLLIDIRIGGRDAMESALLTGTCWSVIGMTLSLLAGWVRLPAREQRIAVTPDFQRPALGLDLACILEFRLGQAIGTAIRLLVRMLSEQELRTWWRDSRRRERGSQDERASDSGPHEDGHGEPQRDG